MANSAKYKCDKCGNVWSSTRPGCKVVCPKCKSHNWKIIKINGKYLP